jgi:hypothetical protein
MSHVQEQKKSQPATKQTESALNQFGQRLGFYTGLATHNIQRAVTSLGEGAKREASQVNQQKLAHPELSGNQAQVGSNGVSQQAMRKAEGVVDNVGQDMTHWTSLAALQIQRAMSRAREEAEDMWAEAQYIRQQSGLKSH